MYLAGDSLFVFDGGLARVTVFEPQTLTGAYTTTLPAVIVLDLADSVQYSFDVPATPVPVSAAELRAVVDREEELNPGATNGSGPRLHTRAGRLVRSCFPPDSWSMR